MRAALLLAPLSFALAACGDGSMPAPDGGGTDTGTPPGDGGGFFELDAAAIAPMPPVLTPCRDGWREVPGELGGTVCDPWPETGRRDDCASDEAHFPGTPTCVTVGSACPADGWPTGLPAVTNIVYVDAAAAAGGDGHSRATAFRGIGEAADRATPGAILAIREGSYDEGEIYVGPGMVLWGACVRGTVIGSTMASPSHGVVFLAEDDTEARNLRIESPQRLGVVSLGARAKLTDVVIHGAIGLGVGVIGGRLTATHVVVSGTSGRGMEAQMGGALDLHQVRVDGALDIGLSVEGAGSVLVAEDVAVAHVDGMPMMASGDGLAMSNGATCTLDGIVVEDVGEYGFYVDEVGSTLTATDVVVRRNTPPITGAGVFVVDGATATFSRVLFEQLHGAGFSPEEPGSHIDVSDAVVRDMLAAPMGDLGRGFDVNTSGALVANRVIIARARDGAVSCADVGSTIDAHDLAIEQPLGTPTGDFGRGVVAFVGGAITLERTHVHQARDIGVTASMDGSSIVANGLIVDDMLGRASLGDYGIAAWAELGGVLTLTDVLIDGARLAGAGAIERGTLTLERAVVRNTRSAACGDTTCTGAPGGFALAAPYGGNVSATDFAIDGAAVCGVVIGTPGMASAASIDLHSGYVTAAPVGACVQVDGYDTARLSDRVEYRDVGVPLQATSYSVPGAVGGF